MRKSDLDALGNCRLFREIEANRTAELCAHCGIEIVPAAKGTAVCTPEKFPRSLCIILKGSATVYKKLPDGRNIIMSRLAPGDIFGMASLFYETDSFPTLIKLDSDGRLLFISDGAVKELFIIEPRLAENYIEVLSQRIHFLTDRLELIADGDNDCKLLRFLSGYYDGEAQPGELVLPFSLTRAAEMLNMTRVSLYRAIDSLEARGIFTHRGSRFYIKDRNAFLHERKNIQ